MGSGAADDLVGELALRLGEQRRPMSLKRGILVDIGDVLAELKGAGLNKVLLGLNVRKLAGLGLAMVMGVIGVIGGGLERPDLAFFIPLTSRTVATYASPRATKSTSCATRKS